MNYSTNIPINGTSSYENYERINAFIEHELKNANWRFLSSRYRGRGRPRNSDYTEGGGGLTAKLDAMCMDTLAAGFSSSTS